VLHVGVNMFTVKAYITSKHLVMVLILLVLLSACTPQVNTATPTAELQLMRVTNSGTTDITGLVVLFPGPNAGAEAIRIEFGDISAGQTSVYLEVPSGVYRYAAYNYVVEGREVMQAVTDWVGESPLTGKKFTYQLALNLTKVEGDQMRLATVSVDEP
jgi:hypothetical protein